MKLEILAECVVRLSECDIDNPADQKTISVCENYILESYNSYLENCEMNEFEPLNQTEYMQNLMLNEGFFKKLLKGAAIAGGVAATGVAAAKGINAVNQNAASQRKAAGIQKGGTFAQNFGNTIKTFGSNAKLFVNQSGGFKGTARNIAQTSMNAKTARQQFAGADRNTTITSDGSSQTIQRSLNLANRNDARQAATNNQNLKGTNTVTTQRSQNGQVIEGTGKTVDANSAEGQAILNNNTNDNPKKSNQPTQQQSNQSQQPTQQQSNQSQQPTQQPDPQQQPTQQQSNQQQSNQQPDSQQPKKMNFAEFRKTLSGDELEKFNNMPATQKKEYMKSKGVLQEDFDFEDFDFENINKPLTGAIRCSAKFI